MKKIMSFLLVGTALVLFNSCEKDCVCKTYDNSDGHLVTVEDWDGDDVSKSDCQGMNRTYTSLMVEYRVECSQK